MRAPSKFLFDVDFSAGGAKPAERAVPMAELAAKVAEAEAAGHRRGLAEGEAKAKAAIERSMAAALESIGRALEKLSSGVQGMEQRLEAEAVDVAVAVARKLAPELIAREPLTELAALASDCFRQLVRAPHVVVRVNDALYERVREKLEALARTRGYDGRLVILGEPDIAIGDCRIEWADGGITRERAAVEAAIGEAVARYVAARRPADR